VAVTMGHQSAELSLGYSASTGKAASIPIPLVAGGAACFSLPQLAERAPGAASMVGPPTRSVPGDPLLQHKYRQLIHRDLSKLQDTLFTEFTGFHFHIAWMKARPKSPAARAVPTDYSVCRQLSGPSLSQLCGACAPKQLARTLSTDGHGHHFTCPCGLRNYWIPIRVRGETLGIAYLQAVHHATASPPGRKPPRAVHARFRQAGLKVLGPQEFRRASGLLRHIVQHVQTASLAELRKADLLNAECALTALQKERAQFQEALRQPLPHTLQSPRPGAAAPHAEQVVHRLLACVEKDYAKPITLQQWADKLGMNAAYLSALFSQAVGTPFRSYLAVFRLTKAKELLMDLAKTVSEVAFAVGYASENRFRLAFKQATGLSPKSWRETMQSARSR
jgi:AraC-like DNA-binding protein